MRLKKSLINSSITIITFIASFLPVFIVRKIFIATLGTELLGLSSLYTNIIGYLSIAEMGIGSAIIFSLYKPFAEGNREKIKGYLSYYQKFYIRVGLIVLGAGLLLTPFIQIFINQSINLNLARITFILFLIDTFISYLFNYKFCILNVAQEGYKISIVSTCAKLAISLFQVISLYTLKSFYIYIIIMIVINLISYIVLNIYIDKQYPWLKETKGVLTEDESHNLVKNVKALFLHKIGSLLVFGTDNIVISSFVSLSTVAFYSNYMLIINSCTNLIGQAISGITSSIGNLLVEKDEKYAYVVHKRLFFITFWIVSFVVISLLNTISQFISLWLGKKYILDLATIALVLFNVYFQLMRNAVEQFKAAAGEYHKDRYIAIIEGGINLVMSIIFVKLIGLPGVFLGTLISNFVTVFWVKPRIVYKYIFKIPLRNYFIMYFKYFIIGVIPLLISSLLTSTLKNKVSIEAFILNCIINIVVINIFYLIIFWRNEHFIYFKGIATSIIKKRKI